MVYQSPKHGPVGLKNTPSAYVYAQILMRLRIKNCSLGLPDGIEITLLDSHMADSGLNPEPGGLQIMTGYVCPKSLENREGIVAKVIPCPLPTAPSPGKDFSHCVCFSLQGAHSPEGRKTSKEVGPDYTPLEGSLACTLWQ